MRHHQQQCAYVLAELQRNEGLDASRGVSSNWNTQLSFPTLAAFTTDAPIGFIAQAEDTGLSYQFSGTAWVVFPSAATLPSIPEAFTKFVSKTGNDATGDGSINKPYLTMGAAVTAIANGGTAAQPWKISLGVGSFASAPIDPWTIVVGAGRNATTLTAGAANILSANWTGATVNDGAIVEATIGYAFVCDFNAVTSTGGRFYLYDSCLLDFSTTWTGGGVVANQVLIQNVQQTTITGAITHTFTNFGSRLRIADSDLRSNGLSFIHTAAFVAGPVITSTIATGTLTINCANAAPNTLNVVINSSATGQPVFVGDAGFITTSGINVSSRQKWFVTSPDANTTFTFSTVSVGASRLMNGGENYLSVTISAARTFTILDPSGNTIQTILRMDNFSTFNVDLVFTGSGAGTTSYVGPGQSVELIWSTGSWHVQTTKVPQSGRGVFAGGVSALIPCDIQAGSSSIALINTNLNGSVAIGLPVVLDTDIVTGTRAGGGGFVARAKTLGGVDVATDNSSFSWIVVR